MVQSKSFILKSEAVINDQNRYLILGHCTIYNGVLLTTLVASTRIVCISSRDIDRFPSTGELRLHLVNGSNLALMNSIKVTGSRKV